MYFGGSQDEKNRSQRFMDTINLFDYGFEQLQVLTLISKGTIIDFAEVKNSKESEKLLPLVINESVSVSADVNATPDDFESEIVISGDLVAPITSGELVGEVTYKIYGQEYKYDLFAGKNVDIKPASFFSKFGIFLFRIAVILGVLIFLFRFYNIFLKKESKKSRVSRVRKYNARFHR